MPYLLLAVSNLLHTGIPSVVKIALIELDSAQLVWMRHTVALIVVTPLAIKIAQSRWSYQDISRLIAAALLAFTITSLLQVESIARSGAAMGALMIALQPIVTISLAALFLHERISFKMVASIALALAGLVVLCGSNTERIEGSLLYIVAILCESSLGIFLRPLLKRHHPLHIAFFCLLVASMALLPFQSGTVARLLTLSSESWICIFYLGAICSGMCTFLWLKSLQFVDVSHSAIMWFIQPLGGSFLAVVALGEPMTGSAAVGGGIILLAVGMLILGVGKNQHNPIERRTAENNLVHNRGI